MEEGADGQSVLLLRPDTASPLEGHTAARPKISTHALSTGAAQEWHPRDRGQPPPGARQGPHMTALPHQGQDGRGLAARRPQASTNTLE